MANDDGCTHPRPHTTSTISGTASTGVPMTPGTCPDCDQAMVLNTETNRWHEATPDQGKDRRPGAGS